MKKIIAFCLAIVMMLSLAACGKNGQPTTSDKNEETVNLSYDKDSLEAMLTFVGTESAAAEEAVSADAEALLTKLGDSYDAYDKNKEAVSEFYTQTALCAEQLYTALQTVAIDYYKCIAANGIDDYDTWDKAMDDFYDAWDEGMDDFYDAWDEAYDDIYDTSDDLIESASDDLEYEDYSEIWSDMYDAHSDSWSDLYDLHSDAWSLLYDNHSDVWSGFYDNETGVDAILKSATENTTRPNDEDTSSNETGDNDTETSSGDAETGALDNITELVEKDVADTLANLTSDYEELVASIDTYEKYTKRVEDVETFYTNVYEAQQDLSIRLREYCVQYAEAILSSGISEDDMYDEFEVLYDVIYDGAGDDIYDGIYDGILDDLYDDFYDGILDDAYDTVPYSEWSDARSNEYEWWSDTRSDVYEDWSDMRSDVYEFWSDVRSEVYGNDIEGAKEEVADFQEDISKLKGKQEDTSNASDNEASVESSTDANNDTELVDGMRPAFKEAMDAYEAFYTEYCEFMQEYSENPTDLTLLAKYSDMLVKAEEMNEAFEEWDEDELNSEELKYYLDVNNRVMKMLVDVAG